MVFKCTRRTQDGIERWQGIIPRLTKHGRYCEIRIEARSGIMVIFGKSSYGYFACMPDLGAGCHLSSLKDRFWNTEQLTRVIGEVDGITVANALYELKDEL